MLYNFFCLVKNSYISGNIPTAVSQSVLAEILYNITVQF